MNNEPVAWRCKKFYETQEGWFYNENEIGELLYTHLVKELDEDFDAICLENKRLQAEIEKLRSWVVMLGEAPFFNEIDHYRGSPVSILRKACET